MIQAQHGIRGYRPDRLDVAAAVAVVILVAGTLAMLALRQVTGHFAAPGIDLMLDTAATLASGAVCALSWIRYRERGEQMALVQVSGFLAVLVAYASAITVAAIGYPSDPARIAGVGEGQALVFATGRVLAAAMLAVGGGAALRGRTFRRPRLLLIAPGVVAGAVVAATWLVPLHLPSPVESVPVRGAAGGPVAAHAVVTWFGIGLELLGAVLTMAAAETWRRLWRRHHVLPDAYLAFGLVIASFAQLHEVLFPGLHPIDVTSGDLLWLVFCALLLLAVEARVRLTMADLGRANERLAALKDTEAERAALEERTRLSRELHDGVAQDLWLAKLKMAALSVQRMPTDQGSIAVAEAQAAIEAALHDARHAVAALRAAPTPGVPFCDLLAGAVEEFSSRFGIRSEFVCQATGPGPSPRAEAELLRIVEEALRNVVRHADATMVRVVVEAADDNLRVELRDNGCGFDPEAPMPGSFGIAGMRERAAMLGGTLVIESAAQSGTRVVVALPLVVEQRAT